MKVSSTVKLQRSLAGLVGMGVLAAPALAAPGDGIVIGDAKITPSLATGFEYHTNVYLSEGTFESGQGTPEVPAFVYYLTPRIGASVDAPKITLGADLGYSLRAFIDTDTTDDFHPSNLNQFTNVDGSLKLDLFPHGRYGLNLEDKLTRGATPAETPEDPTDSTVIHTKNDLYGGVVARPGSALELRLRGHLQTDAYNLPAELTVDSVEQATTYDAKVAGGPTLDVGWKFLPKTQLALTGGVDWNNWDHALLANFSPQVEGSTVGDWIGKPDSVAWRAKLGVKGQITPKVAVIAMLGYGQAYYDEQSVLDDASSVGLSATSSELAYNADGTGEDFARDLTAFSEGFLVDLQAGYAPFEGQKFVGGYRKDFLDTVFSNYVLYNYLYVRYTGTFVRKLNLGAELGYRIDAYHGDIARTDQSVVAKASGTWQFTPWFSTGIQGGWSRRACMDSECENGQYYTIQYDDFYGQLGVTFKY